MMPRLSTHETVLVLLYRVAPIELRRHIDADLFDYWTRMPCSLDPKAPESGRHRAAAQSFHTCHVAGHPLRSFTTFWHQSKR